MCVVTATCGENKRGGAFFDAAAAAEATARDGRLTIMGSAGIREVSTTSSWKGDVVFRLIILRNLSGRFQSFLQRKPMMIMIPVREHVHKMSALERGISEKLISQDSVMSGKLVIVS